MNDLYSEWMHKFWNSITSLELGNFESEMDYLNYHSIWDDPLSCPGTTVLIEWGNCYGWFEGKHDMSWYKCTQ